MSISRGVWIPNLKPEPRRLAEELDNNPDVRRNTPSELHNHRLDRAEIEDVLRPENLSQFNSREQQWLKALGVATGLNVPGLNLPRTWVERTPSPLAFAQDGFLGAVKLNDSIYFTTSQGFLGRYEPQTDLWTGIEQPPLPSGFYGTSSRLTTLGDRLVYFVGNEGAQLAQNGPAGLMFLYDPSTLQWSAPIPTETGPGAALAAFQDATGGQKLYTFGGGSFRGGADYSERYSTLAEVHDVATGQTTSLPPLPIARAGASAVAVGNKIYVIGGATADRLPSRRIDILDVATGEWQEPAFLPRGRTDASVWLEGDRLHVAAGQQESPWSASASSEILDVSNPSAPKYLGEGELIRFSPSPVSSFARVVQFGERRFAFGVDIPDHNTRHVFTREWATDHSAVDDLFNDGSTIIEQDNRSTTNIGIDVDTRVVNKQINVEQNLINVVNVSAVQNNIHQALNVLTQNSHFTVAPLFFERRPAEAGFFDKQHNFFVRTEAQGQPLLHIVESGDGDRTLVGSPGTLPPNRPASSEALFLYHPATNQLLPIRSGNDGSLGAVTLGAMRGEAYLFSKDFQGNVSGAGRIWL